MIRTVRRCLGILTLSLLVLCWISGVQASGIAVKNGQTIAFLGDSITEYGWNNPTGYVKLTVAGLRANGIRVTSIPAGISGNTSDHMLNRLKPDVLDKKPDWMIVSCGVNDVLYGVRGVPLARYKNNITAIVDRCKAAGLKVVILTATVIGEDLDNKDNKKLALYNEFLRMLAKEKKCLLADINAMFHKRIKDGRKPGYLLTYDGIHLNPAGDKVMAMGILRIFGLNIAQIRKAEKAWMHIRGHVNRRAIFKSSL
ncbi:MAG: SGNH/GDSL hydrolase family protein [Thermodesulfobacteriota bacterium]|jgi:lysophospholipase L1-like esterase